MVGKNSQYLKKLERKYFIIEQVLYKRLLMDNKLSKKLVDEYFESINCLPVFERTLLVYDIWDTLTTYEKEKSEYLIKKTGIYNEFPNDDLKTDLLKIL